MNKTLKYNKIFWWFCRYIPYRIILAALVVRCAYRMEAISFAMIPTRKICFQERRSIYVRRT